MGKLGSCYIVYGNDVESLAFDWGTVKLFSESEVTGTERMSFGMVVLASGEGEQMLGDEPAVRVRPGASIYIPQGVFHMGAPPADHRVHAGRSRTDAAGNPGLPDTASRRGGKLTRLWTNLHLKKR